MAWNNSQGASDSITFEEWNDMTTCILRVSSNAHPISISSQYMSGGTVKTHDLTIRANTISGLIDPIYPSAAASKHYVNYPDYVSSQGISGAWRMPIYRTSKPNASAGWDGRIIMSSGGANKSRIWVCAKNDASTYEWIQIGISS
jgi:hypothetical protein